MKFISATKIRCVYWLYKKMRRVRINVLKNNYTTLKNKIISAGKNDDFKT